MGLRCPVVGFLGPLLVSLEVTGRGRGGEDRLKGVVVGCFRRPFTSQRLADGPGAGGRRGGVVPALFDFPPQSWRNQQGPVMSLQTRLARKTTAFFFPSPPLIAVSDGNALLRISARRRVSQDIGVGDDHSFDGAGNPRAPRQFTNRADGYVATYVPKNREGDFRSRAALFICIKWKKHHKVSGVC